MTESNNTLLTSLNDSLGRLVLLQEGMEKRLEAIEKQSKKAGKSEEDSNKEQKKSGKHIKDISAQVPVIGKALRKFGNLVTGAFKETFDLQKKALSRGLTLKGMRQQMQPTTDALTGMTDGITALQIGTESYAAGLRQNNQAVNNLMLMTKVTGGNAKKLAKDLAANTAGLQDREGALTRLGSRTQQLAQTFGMTTEELVGAMTGLSKDLHDLAALGIGAEFQEAAMVLAAGLGPEMANLAPDVLKALSSGSNMIQNSMLGGAEIISQLNSQQGDKSRQSIEAMLQMGDEAQRISKNYTEGAHHQRFAMDLFKKVHGEHSVMYMRAAQQFRQEARERGMSDARYTEHLIRQQRISNNYVDAWDNFKRVVWEPFQTGFLDVMTKIIDVFKANKGTWMLIAKVVGTLTAVVGSLVAALKGFAAIRYALTALRHPLQYLEYQKRDKNFVRDLAERGTEQGRSATSGRFTQRKGMLARLGDSLSGLAKGLRSMGSKTAST